MTAAILEGIRLARELVQLAQGGMSREEIQKRMADPDGPARRLVDAATATRRRVKDYVENG